MWFSYNAVNFLTNIYKEQPKVHTLGQSISFVGPASDWYSTSVPAIIYAILTILDLVMTALDCNLSSIVLYSGNDNWFRLLKKNIATVTSHMNNCPNSEYQYPFNLPFFLKSPFWFARALDWMQSRCRITGHSVSAPSWIESGVARMFIKCWSIFTNLPGSRIIFQRTINTLLPSRPVCT